MQRKKRGKPGRKPVVRAECLARLKGGASSTELLGEFKPGPLYDALREYLIFSAGEVEEIGKSKIKARAQMQSFASYGFLLMRVPNDRLIAERVPAIFVSLMATSIDSWVREMMPEAETKPPKDVTQIAPYYSQI